MNYAVTFELEAECPWSGARAGKFHTPHGTVETPVFMPVGTNAALRALTFEQTADCGAQIVLSNSYHLYLRPGHELIKEAGGLHKFMNWHKPILTDSGGFQVFSLDELRKITDKGVFFKDHRGGREHFIGPGESMTIQNAIGADIIMAFDECAVPTDYDYSRLAMRRTHAWARRCLEAKTRGDQALFGIVQGGVFSDLRAESAREISAMGFPGHAIGGLSVGESKADMYRTIAEVNSILPEDKPRYLMGVGTPEDLIEGVRRGVDIFDCVLPTRLARHNTAMTIFGKLNLMNASFARDERPIDSDCQCYTCRTFTRAYLRHLIVAKEMLAATLLSIHNLYTLVNLTARMRQAILAGEMQHFAQETLAAIAASQTVEEEI